MSARRIAGAGLAAAAIAAASGCGDADAEQGAGSQSEVIATNLGERTGKLDCTDWERGTEAERRGTVEQLTLVAEGNSNPEDVGPNRVLPRDKAYEVFESWCGAPAARGFLLYDLYNRAAVFATED